MLNGSYIVDGMSNILAPSIGRVSAVPQHYDVRHYNESIMATCLAAAVHFSFICKFVNVPYERDLCIVVFTRAFKHDITF